MAIVKHHTREVVFKIVYCGTPLGGKTTNLQAVQRRLGPDVSGDLVSMATSEDSTLFFDFLPVDTVVINGYKTRFQLYTVPGQVSYNATRQLVLQGADGLVFVIDSQTARMEENVAAYRGMFHNLGLNRISAGEIPLALQYNKRDLPDIAPVDYLNYLFNSGPSPLPAFEASAASGHNVFETLDAVAQMVLRRFHAQITAAQKAAPTAGGAAPPQGKGDPNATSRDGSGHPPAAVTAA